MTPKIVAAIVLLGLALVAGADFWELACPVGSGEENCALAAGDRDDEASCDHCLACVVAHGHVLALVPDASPALAGLAGIRFPRPSLLLPARILFAEFFRPPIRISR